MNNSEIRSLSIEELRDRLLTEKDALQKLKFAHTISPIENPSKIQSTRKLIARIATELGARDLNTTEQ